MESQHSPLPSQPASLLVAVLTFHRPDHASEIVPALDAAASEVTDGRRIRILVVDNDPDGDARDVVEAAAAKATHDVTYVVEPTPGITAGRNRALEECREDLIAFIDDDERPEPGWLPHLLATMASTGAEIVTGPVERDYEVQPDAWIKAGGWFNHPHPPTGTEMPAAATNNVIFDMRFLRAQGIRFDSAFGLSGGEDTMISLTAIARGARIVWCDEAVVVDRVPAARVKRDWIIRRAYRSGNSWAAVNVALAGGSVASRATNVVRGVTRVLGGAAKVGWATVRRDIPMQSRSVRTMVRGAGMVAGAVGSRYAEYNR